MTNRSTFATDGCALTSASSTSKTGRCDGGPGGSLRTGKRVGDDPRAGSGVGSALRSELFSRHHERVVLVHSTKESGLRMAAGMDHVIEGPSGTETTVESSEDLGRVTVA